MTLAQLAVTVALLAALGLVASRFGLSAIPAYLLAGLLLGPNEPKVLSLDPALRGDGLRGRARASSSCSSSSASSSRSARLAAQPAPRRSRRVRSTWSSTPGSGSLVGVAAFGLSFGGLHPRRRDLRLLERDHRQGADRLPAARRRRDRPRARDPRRRGPRDRLRARVRRRAAAASATHTPGARRRRRSASSRLVARRISKWLQRPDRPLPATGCRGSSSCWPPSRSSSACAALAEELGLSEAIGALMAGVVLSETSVREEIEERFFSFRDVFAALFFFVFGLSIDVGALGSVGLAARRAPWSRPRRQDRRRLREPACSAATAGGRA